MGQSVREGGSIPAGNDKQKYCRNVKRWSSADMVLRWSSAMLLEVEKRFRKIRGYRSMSQLLAALSAVNMDNKKATG